MQLVGWALVAIGLAAVAAGVVLLVAIGVADLRKRWHQQVTEQLRAYAEAPGDPTKLLEALGKALEAFSKVLDAFNKLFVGSQLTFIGLLLIAAGAWLLSNSR